MDVRTLTLPQLEQLLEEYPWFTVARKEYVRRRGAFGEEELREAAARAGLYLLSRTEFFNEVMHRHTRQIRETPQEEQTITPEPQPQVKPVEPQKPKIYVVGGDYFGKDDFKALGEAAEEIDRNLDFNPITATLDKMDPVKAPQQDAKSTDPCSETLANIYMKQELYDRAIEVYEKLILLYPQKSTYFATLIEKARNIKQI